MDEEALRAKISRLTGQINRRKHEGLPPQPDGHGYPYPPRHTTEVHWRGPYRGRGTRGRGAVQFRNPALVKTSQSTSDSDASSDGVTVRQGSSLQWKNPETFERDCSRQKKIATELGRKSHQTERQQVLQAAQHDGRVELGQMFLTINNIKFRVDKGGSKLTRMSNDPSLAEKTPKEFEINGVPFRRTKNGNLVRARAVGRVPMIEKTNLCPRFTSTGTCSKGTACHGIHDSSKTAICPVFLRSGVCPSGSMCDLSHDPSPERVPTCTHFLRGNCTNPKCPYSHSTLNPAAGICRSFALLGYCKNGQSCPERHLRECPDYFSTGLCKVRKCSLPHIDRAGHMRTRTALAVAPARAGKTGYEMDVDNDDVSSEDELYDRIDCDDVDSDALDEPEEVLGGDDNEELSHQHDFVHL